MGKKKIVIDANNLISALGWEGKPKELFRKVIDKEYDLYISIKQIAELEEVMNYPKFSFSEEQKKDFLEIIFEIANIVDTKTNLNVIKEDPDDNVLLECAVEVNADYIISGDKHLRKLKEFGKIKIVSVSEFLEIL
ncbi:putative toxin-antitoxin system toxin component, PIN family [Candidatus Woesearchaeota archaeon]|nr:putative toxin-antitoxin system toxin component, PIN family [Candidatus Woesearchaeota archaeon]